MKIVTSVERAFQLKPYVNIKFFISVEGDVKDESEVKKLGERMFEQELDTIHSAYFKYKDELSAIKDANDLPHQWELLKIREALKNVNGGNGLFHKIRVS